MALSTIEIEQITGGGWVMRIEVGGMVAKRVQVATPTLAAALEAVAEAYQAIAPAADVQHQLIEPTAYRQGQPPPSPHGTTPARLPPLRDARGGRT